MKLRKFAAFAAALILASSVCVFPAFADDQPTVVIAENISYPAEETAEAAETPAAEKMSEGIHEIDGKSYCYDKNGEMRTNYLYTDADGNKYYFRKNGERAENASLILDGKFYRFGKDGKAVYEDPDEGSGVTTLKMPPVLGVHISTLFGGDDNYISDTGIVCWKKTKPRVGRYAYNAHTFINGKKCPMTLEFDSTNCLTTWYLDIPANEEEQTTIILWAYSLWGIDCEIDDELNAAYWFYTDDATGQKRGIAMASTEDMISISGIAL